MTSASRHVATMAGAAALALAIFSLPTPVSLAATMLVVVGFGCVALAAQVRRFDDESRLVYRPVYVRARNVQRRVRSFED